MGDIIPLELLSPVSFILNPNNFAIVMIKSISII
jgi:hypothetical protein